MKRIFFGVRVSVVCCRCGRHTWKYRCPSCNHITCSNCKAIIRKRKK